MMEDDFYEPLSTTNSVGPASRPLFSLFNILSSSPSLLLVAFILALPLVLIAMRPNGGYSEESDDREKNTIWIVPHSTPLIGHWLQL